MKIAVVGYGVVGSGVVEVFYKNRAKIEKQVGQPMDIKYIVDIKDLSAIPHAEKWTKNFEEVLADPEVGIVVETMGGLKPAYDFSKRSLEAGKHVITSNKELVATYGAELLAIAKEHAVNYLFEASVGGGIPVLHPLYQCLGGGDITEILGILNGTTNFIMTRMNEDGMSFEAALKLAQKNGYAEQNPAADVEGKDACRKICILSSLAFGKHVYPDEVRTEGITHITTEDVAVASKAGYAIKLIGRVVKHGETIIATVAPALLPQRSQLGVVSDVYNAILVRGSDLGDVLFYGQGAGKAATASAVLSDVMDAVIAGKTISTLGWADAPHNTNGDDRNDILPYFVRCKADSLDRLKAAFGCEKQVEDENAFLTPPLLCGKAEELAAGQDGVISCLRILK